MAIESPLTALSRLLDKPSPDLSYEHGAFAREYVANGRDAKKAYAKVYPGVSLASLSQGAYTLMKRIDVQTEIARLMRPMETEARLTRQEIDAFLKLSLLTPVGDVDAKSMLAQEVHYNDEGGVKRVKMVSKMEAASMAARLDGMFAPDRVAHVVESEVESMVAGLLGVMDRDAIDVDSEIVETGGELSDTSHNDADDWF